MDSGKGSGKKGEGSRDLGMVLRRTKSVTVGVREHLKLRQLLAQRNRWRPRKLERRKVIYPEGWYRGCLKGKVWEVR